MYDVPRCKLCVSSPGRRCREETSEMRDAFSNHINKLVNGRPNVITCDSVLQIHVGRS